MVTLTSPGEDGTPPRVPPSASETTPLRSAEVHVSAQDRLNEDAGVTLSQGSVPAQPPEAPFHPADSEVRPQTIGRPAFVPPNFNPAPGGSDPQFIRKIIIFAGGFVVLALGVYFAIVPLYRHFETLPSPTATTTIEVPIKKFADLWDPGEHSIGTIPLSHGELLKEVQASVQGHVGYIVENTQKFNVFVTGQETREYEFADTLRFSPDGRRVVYRIRREGREIAVIDGVEGKPYASLSPIFFSLDSKRVLYVVSEQGKKFVVWDGKEGKRYDSIATTTPVIVFHPKGSDFIYRAKVGTKWRIVFNDQEGRLYDEIDDPTFSPDAARWGYTARRGPRWYLVINDKETRITQGITTSSFRASKNLFKVIPTWATYYPVMHLRLGMGTKNSYIGKIRKMFYGVVEGKASKPFTGIGSSPSDFLYSQDGTHFAYSAIRGKKALVVRDSKEGKLYDSVSNFVFSPGSARFAYVASEGSSFFIVLDDQEAQIGDTVAISTPKFSASSEHIAYLIQKSGKFILVADGRQSAKSYEGAWGPYFSPDGRKVGYGALVGDQLMWVVEELR